MQDQILDFLKVTGPTTPTRVAKIIRSDIIIGSAHLSDLASQGKVRISNLKIGGSPLYYLPGQEAQLYQFASSNLNPKDFAVLERLKNEEVLREAELDLLAKVALRSLKDFAVPLQVRTPDRAELFWKWYLLPDDATNQLVRKILYPPQPVLPINPQPVTEERLLEQHEALPVVPLISIPAHSNKVEMITERVASTTTAMVQNSSEEKERTGITEAKRVRTRKQSEPEYHGKQTILGDKGETLPAQTDEPRVKPTGKRKAPDPDRFLPEIERFFQELNITIQEQDVVRKNADFGLVIKVPTVVGKMTYYCKAKKKARCDEKDLSAAYVEAQMKKLPLLFLYSQDLTKKAQEMLDAGAFENVIVKKIE